MIIDLCSSLSFASYNWLMAEQITVRNDADVRLDRMQVACRGAALPSSTRFPSFILFAMQTHAFVCSRLFPCLFVVVSAWCTEFSILAALRASSPFL